MNVVAGGGAISTAVNDAGPSGEWVPEIPAGRYGTSEEMAEAAVCPGPNAARYITGQQIVLDGGVSVCGPFPEQPAGPGTPECAPVGTTERAQRSRLFSMAGSQRASRADRVTFLRKSTGVAAVATANTAKASRMPPSSASRPTRPAPSGMAPKLKSRAAAP